MKKIIRLTEDDLARIVKRVIEEQSQSPNPVQIAAAANPAGAVALLGTQVWNYILSNAPSANKVKTMCDYCNRPNTKSQPTVSSNRNADIIRDAVQGIGTNEDAIASVFKRLTSLSDFCSMVKSYKQSYGVDLYSDLDGDIDSESEWNLIMRPLRDLVTKQNQSVQTTTRPTQQTARPTQQTARPTQQTARPTQQTTKAAPAQQPQRPAVPQSKTKPTPTTPRV